MAEGKVPGPGTGATGKGAAAKAPRKIAEALSRPPGPRRAREILLLEMRRLRALFLEISERYVANVEAEAAALIRSVEGRNLPAAAVKELLKPLRSLEVKPQKGRRKDLTRIERTIVVLRGALEEKETA